MDTMLEQMLKHYDAKTIYEKKNAIKEIIQEIVLCGLSRSGFFREAAFYGGTALRIFYGLDRFSEDLDFSLMRKNQNFDLKQYFPALEQEIRAYGLKVIITEKEKTKKSDIKSAFLKGNTKEHLLLFYSDQPIAGIADSEQIKIKFEVDTNPPAYAIFESKYRLHLRERLLQSGYIGENMECTMDDVKKMLLERFETIDYEQAKRDVEPFIRDTTSLALWKADFFKQITEMLVGIN